MIYLRKSFQYAEEHRQLTLYTGKGRVAKAQVAKPRTIPFYPRLVTPSLTRRQEKALWHQTSAPPPLRVSWLLFSEEPR